MRLAAPLTETHLADAIEAATASVFSTMLGMEVAPGEACEQMDPPPLNGVTALLGFTGKWVGTGMFCCRERLACELSSVMLMASVDEVNNQVLDGVGEIANMLLGNFKDRLETAVGAMDMSIPTVIYSLNFHIRTPILQSWLVVPFRAGEHAFEVRVCLAPRSGL
jgi:chemotaxis protein CheX